ncbi:MAG TPA: response regulator [Thiobacillaceae bacterium]|nr:response regulator [Thiobacillaceae bacterium]HNA81612.1 response regulator [Thiobacillaceae bacterium]HNF88871.1 response regulator [Thiobacillaceae bacterium]HNH88383.1 response regulator [Thiobacillaceae bacterium]HNI07476.1 response regulator [Thiobacillaceae bacterium]
MRIAIIDDNPVNLKLMESLVKRAGDYSPNVFQESATGLEWCLANNPDLVIVDYMMPHPDGLEFIRRFRAEPANVDVPILMITADHEKETRYAALETGANDFLTKPIDNSEFRARLRNMLSLRRSQKALADRAAWLAEKVAEATTEILDREREMVTRLSMAAEFRDPETGAHIQRMAHYSLLIADQLGLSADDKDMILGAAPMHDVGKIAIPDHILLKPGRLDDAELAIMRTHAEKGYEILRGSKSRMLDLAAIIAWTHHEKFDGTGYPRCLAGEDIPLPGRIVAVADVFDALTSERPYKKAWELERAIVWLQECAGTHFDPACVGAFLSRHDDMLDIRASFRDDVVSNAHL